MSDKDKLDELIQNTPKWTTEHFDHLKKIKAALDRERTKHAKEIVALQQRISDLEAQLQDEKE